MHSSCDNLSVLGPNSTEFVCSASMCYRFTKDFLSRLQFFFCDWMPVEHAVSRSLREKFLFWRWLNSWVKNSWHVLCAFEIHNRIFWGFLIACLLKNSSAYGCIEKLRAFIFRLVFQNTCFYGRGFSLCRFMQAMLLLLEKSVFFHG